jgi:hypothetical protein
MRTLYGLACVAVAAVTLAALVSHVVAVLPPSIVCPEGYPSTECYNFTVPLNYANTSAGSISVFVSIFSQTRHSETTGVVWYLGFGCDGFNIDTSSDWMTNLVSQNNVMVAIPHMRGDGFSYPRLFCTQDPAGTTDPPTALCGQQLAQQYGANYLANYNLDNAAQDINNLVSQVFPAKPNYLIGSRHGSLWAQRVQAMYPTLFTRAVLADYTNPMVYDFFAAFAGREAAVRNVISQCEQDATCVLQLGGGQNLQALLDRTMRLAELGLLPCNAQLSEFAPTMPGTNWRHVYSTMLAALVGPKDPWTAPDINTAALVLPVLYRLQRCQPAQGDVYVLQAVFGNITAFNMPPAPPTPVSPTMCTGSAVLRANILLNEFVRNDPVETVQYILQAMTLAPDPAYLLGWLDFYRSFPLWRQPSANANDANKWYSSTATQGQVKLAGSLDPNLPPLVAQTTSQWDTAASTHLETLTNVPGFLATSPVAPNQPSCAGAVMVSWFNANNSLANINDCVSNPNPLDLLGTAPATANARQRYFGSQAGDVWNWQLSSQGTFIIPSLPFTTLAPPTAPPPPPTPSPPVTTATPPRPNTTHAAPDEHTKNLDAIIGGGVGAGLFLILVIVIYCMCCRKRQAHPTPFSAVNSNNRVSSSIQYGDPNTGYAASSAGSYSSYHNPQQPAPQPQQQQQPQSGWGATNLYS